MANLYEVREISGIDNKNIKLGKTFKYGNSNLTNIYYMDKKSILPNPVPVFANKVLPNPVPVFANKVLPKSVPDLPNKVLPKSVPDLPNKVLPKSVPDLPNKVLLDTKDIEKQEKQDEKTKLIFQTPLMYIPNSIIYFNEKPFLELSFNNEDNDKDVIEFKKWLLALEDYVFKLIKRRASLGITTDNKITSIIKNGYYNSKLLVPININISKCILNDDKHKILFNWEIPVPTYGISIIWVKNIWVKNGKWGINLFMYASRVMNSHILDPIDFMGKDCNDDNNYNNNNNNDNNNDNNNNNNNDNNNDNDNKVYDIVNKFNRQNKEDDKTTIQIGQVPEYTLYFKMLKMGIPKDAIKQKMILNNINNKVIDYPENTPYITVLHYISNPALGSYIKPVNTGQNDDMTIGISSRLDNVDKVDRVGLLSAITGFKLKKCIHDSIAVPVANDKVKTLNINKMKVPSLIDIQGALARLKKVDIDSSIT